MIEVQLAMVRVRHAFRVLLQGNQLAVVTWQLALAEVQERATVVAQSELQVAADAVSIFLNISKGQSVLVEEVADLSAKLKAAADGQYQTGRDKFNGSYTNCTTLENINKVYPGFGAPLCYAPGHKFRRG